MADPAVAGEHADDQDGPAVDVRHLRICIGEHAARAERAFDQLRDQAAGYRRAVDEDDPSRDQLAHWAGLYGWALVSLLGYIADVHGAAAAAEAAEMIDEIGMNGDAVHVDDELDAAIAARVAEHDALLAEDAERRRRTAAPIVTTPAATPIL